MYNYCAFINDIYNYSTNVTDIIYVLQSNVPLPTIQDCATCSNYPSMQDEYEEDNDEDNDHEEDTSIRAPGKHHYALVPAEEK
jgi:hypothetical protein